MAKISELLHTKIENTILRLQNLQMATEPTQAKQRELIEEARKEVGASVAAQYNHQLQEFEEPRAPEAS